MIGDTPWNRGPEADPFPSVPERCDCCEEEAPTEAELHPCACERQEAELVLVCGRLAATENEEDYHNRAAGLAAANIDEDEGVED